MNSQPVETTLYSLSDAPPSPKSKDDRRDGERHLTLDRGGSILQLSTIDGQSNIAVNVVVDDVDTTWAEIIERGFVPPDRPESPVHQGPLDQTWHSREFYLDDPSGNTLRFRSWPK